MESRPPLALLLVAITGAVLFTAGRTGQPAKPGPQAGAVAPPQGASQTDCDATPEPLRPLCTEFFRPGDPPKAWKQQAWLRRAKVGLTAVLAMVSDPEQTGDTLSFDRAVESVQNAAESLAYSMHRYWIPWRPAQRREPDKPAEAADARRKLDEPGVLLFRAGGGFLLVFLVGESPVFGVERLQFLNALRYMEALGSDLGCVRGVGPNFSGSFPSLSQAIHAYGPGRIRQFRLISPSATVKDAGERFGRPRPDQCGAATQGPADTTVICYDSIVHNDRYADEHLRAYLARRWGLGPREQAVLSESSTDFGSSLRTGADQRLQVGFPRGIVRLRYAYPEASARNLFAPAGGAAQAAEQERLQVPLTGPGSGGERMPGLPNQQIPVTQEAMLLEIASNLRQQDIRVAQIGATDVFDSIFIAGFLAKAYPELRLYFADSDWLVPRAAERLPLVGSLAVTTFPLMAANQLWPDPDLRALNPMSSRSEVGFFNAFRALLLEQRMETKPLLEYAAAPGRSTGRPPLWLTVVGTNGYWPVALLDGDEVDGDPLQLKWGGAPALEPAWPKIAAPGRIWLTVLCILVGAALVLGAVVILAQSETLCRRFGSKLALWAARPAEGGAYGRAYFTMAECLLLGLMVLVMGTPAWKLARHGPEELAVASPACVLALAVLAAAALAPWVAIFRRRGAAGQWGYLPLAVLVCLGVAGFAARWAYLMPNGDDPALQALFFSYRSLDLSNGVNPVLPLLLEGAGLLAVAFLHHRRHAMFLEMPRVLPELGKEAPLAGLEAALEQSREPLGHPLVSAQPLGWLLAAAGGATMTLLPFEGQQSIEGQHYDLLYVSMLVLFYGLVVLTWARMILVWLRLRPALDRLACHPLREAIAALPPGYSASPILQGAGRYGVTEWLAASLRAARAFLRSVPESYPREALTRRLDRIQEESRELLSLQHPLAPRLARLRSLEKSLAYTGTEIADWLQPHWEPGCQQTADAEAVRAGNEFIALQYAAFLGRMMLQFRGLLVYVVVGFVLAMVSTLVYPFRSQQELVWAGTLSFVVLGLPVAVAVVRMEHHPVVAALTRRGEHGGAAATLLRLALYAAAPVVAVVTPHFPALGRFLVSLLQPAMQALR